ncbi:hypothetical protein VSP10_17335, partial [Myroides odoratimimus]|nr:hypothetical protein [Myroides odoratimimus]
IYLNFRYLNIRIFTFFYALILIELRFIAISKTSKTEGKQYEIVYPNGVKLRLETKDLGELYSLVNLV